MQIVTTDTIGDQSIRVGSTLTACAVTGANVIRDFREAITNTVGGKMTKYEQVIDETLARALDKLAEKARGEGYSGIVGLRISHPVITDGAIEVVVCGTGFWSDESRDT